MSRHEKYLLHHQKLTKLVIQSTPRAMVGFAVFACVFVFYQRHFIPTSILAIWSICMLTVIVLRLLNANMLAKAINLQDLNKTQFHIIVLFAICIYSVCVWSAMSVLGFLYAPSPAEFLPIVITIMLIFGAAYSLAPFQHIFLFFIVSLLLFQSLILFYIGGELQVLIGLLLIFSIPVLRGYSKALFEDQIRVIELNETMAEANKQLLIQTTTDALTNIYNRRYFFDIGNKMFSLSKRESKKISLLMIDLDKFKTINDTYGHQVGDDTIVAVANFVKKRIRASDIFARVGGEEFAIILNNTDIHEAKIFAKMLCDDIANIELACASETFNITVSIGVAEINDNIKTLQSLYVEADKRLYKAKNNGRNQVVFA